MGTTTLVTGGAGALGSNLAAELLRRGQPLTIVDDLSRTGSERNLRWLQERGDFAFEQLDVCDGPAVAGLIRRLRPEVVFHLAGQVAMTRSLEDPLRDFAVNAGGTLHLLEAVRQHAPEAAVVYSSTNKVYGDLAGVALEERPTRYVAPGHPLGFAEDLPLSFHSPYGCSKGAADQYVLDYSRMFGLRGVVFRHSSIYGERQFATIDQGWLGWFTAQALQARDGAEPFTICGDGKQVRDVLYASDLVDVYLRAVESIDQVAGEAFNIGGGPSHSLSLLELFAFLEEALDVRLRYRRLPWRPSDQRVFVADIRKAVRRLGWRPQVSKEEGLRRMIAWVAERA